jgi:hypothetical protein
MPQRQRQVSPRLALKADAFRKYNNIAHIATVNSWDAEFIGNIPMILHGILRHHTTTGTIDPQPYARVVSHVQSSGTGKSRAHDELAKIIFYIPLNLAVPGKTSMHPLSAYSAR